MTIRKAIISCLIFILLLLLLLPGLIINLSTFHKIFKSNKNIGKSKVVIVLGAGVYKNKKMSAILKDRVDTGISLYKKGITKKMLLSGDHGTPYYDEVNAMKKHALEKGVKAEDIFLDHAGYNTYDSLYRAKHFFRIDEAIIVSQKYHLPRALYIAHHLGIKAKGKTADIKTYDSPSMNKWRLREFGAQIKAFYSVHFVKPLSKEQLTIIPIDGDGRKSWDKN